MFLFYVLSFFKKGDTIQVGTLFKEIMYFHMTVYQNGSEMDIVSFYNYFNNKSALSFKACLLNIFWLLEIGV